MRWLEQQPKGHQNTKIWVEKANPGFDFAELLASKTWLHIEKGYWLKPKIPNNTVTVFECKIDTENQDYINQAKLMTTPKNNEVTDKQIIRQLVKASTKESKLVSILEKTIITLQYSTDAFDNSEFIDELSTLIQLHN